MDVSAWWLLGAFLIGGYAGALLVALMAVSARDGGSPGRLGGHGRMSESGPNPRWSI